MPASTASNRRTRLPCNIAHYGDMTLTELTLKNFCSHDRCPDSAWPSERKRRSQSDSTIRLVALVICYGYYAA